MARGRSTTGSPRSVRAAAAAAPSSSLASSSTASPPEDGEEGGAGAHVLPEACEATTGSSSSSDPRLPNRACDRCHFRKTKCVRRETAAASAPESSLACTRCWRLGAPCVFTEPGQRRTLTSEDESYFRRKARVAGLRSGGGAQVVGAAAATGLVPLEDDALKNVDGLVGGPSDGGGGADVDADVDAGVDADLNIRLDTPDHVAIDALGDAAMTDFDWGQPPSEEGGFASFGLDEMAVMPDVLGFQHGASADAVSAALAPLLGMEPSTVPALSPPQPPPPPPPPAATGLSALESTASRQLGPRLATLLMDLEVAAAMAPAAVVDLSRPPPFEYPAAESLVKLFDLTQRLLDVYPEALTAVFGGATTATTRRRNQAGTCNSEAEGGFESEPRGDVEDERPRVETSAVLPPELERISRRLQEDTDMGGCSVSGGGGSTPAPPLPGVARPSSNSPPAGPFPSAAAASSITTPRALLSRLAAHPRPHNVFPILMAAHSRLFDLLDGALTAAITCFHHTLSSPDFVEPDFQMPAVCIGGLFVAPTTTPTTTTTTTTRTGSSSSSPPAGAGNTPAGTMLMALLLHQLEMLGRWAGRLKEGLDDEASAVAVAGGGGGGGDRPAQPKAKAARVHVEALRPLAAQAGMLGRRAAASVADFVGLKAAIDRFVMAKQMG